MTTKPILIVEDHQGLRTGLQELFEEEGYQVLLAEHGQAALDLLDKTSTPKPSLILVDYRMPVMNGPAFLLELQRIHPKIFADTPIFIMSAGFETHQPTIKTTGFLKKPFDIDELLRIAKQYCGQ